MQKRLPTELISPIVARVVAEHLDDLIAGARSLLPKVSPVDEESYQPLDPKVQPEDSANPSDDPIKSLLVASFQIRKATLKVLGEFVGVAYEDEGVGRLASNPWLVIEAVRMSCAEKLELATADHKDALESLTGRRECTLLFVYVACKRQETFQPLDPEGLDFDSDSMFDGAGVRLKDLKAADELLRRSPAELTYRLRGRLSDACLDLINERVASYCYTLDGIVKQHSKYLASVQRITSSLARASQAGVDLGPRPLIMVYQLAATGANAMLKVLLKATLMMWDIVSELHYSNDVDSAIAALTESLVTVTKFAAYEPESIHDASESHESMVDTATLLRVVVRILCIFLGRRKSSSGDVDDSIAVSLTSKELGLLSSMAPGLQKLGSSEV